MFETNVASALLSAALAVVGVAALGRAKSHLQGTTLVAVWWWTTIALATLAIAELCAGAIGVDERFVPPLRLAGATSTLCPIMALLGAKRPQDRGWQFVVAALWCISCLPGGRWLVLGSVEEVHPAQLGFLAILILVGAVNGLPTRFWPSTLLACGGQLALFAPFFQAAQPWIAGGTAAVVGMTLIVAAIGLAVAGIPPARVARVPLDRVWLDFRDAFGTVWALRVMERMNAAAVMYGWPVALNWSGFVERDSAQADVEFPPAIEDSLRTLLRRFVSPEWIDARLAAESARAKRPVAL
jgi:hypothetical protein